MKKTVLLVLVLRMSAEIAHADFTFGQPTNLGATVNSLTDDYFPNISVDGLTLYFQSRRSGSYGPYDLWVTTRRTTDDQWGEPVNLGPVVNSSAQDGGPSISADGLSLYFHSVRSGVADVWVTTRATTSGAWLEPVNLGPTVNSSASDVCPRISSDGLSLFFESARDGGYGGRDLWVTTRATLADAWGPAVNLGPNVNTSDGEVGLDVSADGLALIFSSNRPEGSGDYDLWVTTRSTVSDPWGPAANLGQGINTIYGESGPNISADGLSLYFCDYNLAKPGGSGGIDLWQTPIIPIVDLNADGIVDAADVSILVDHWGTDNSLCDISPMPWGDGTVDVEDLKVLAEYLFGDMQCVAHFRLDEAKGSIANDSARNRDGTVHGYPAWQLTGGVDGGALQLDGVDDYVSTAFVLNPAEGDFSVLAWVKGGADGQAIVSQEGGVNWLMVDGAGGALRTDLKVPAKEGRGATPAGPPLISSAVVIDGDWHRVGFVRNGDDRILYVDGKEVVRDAAVDLEPATGGLYLGAASSLEPGTFFSGLIDDVRIYNRAVKP
ncbi:MAG: PD40 domain-containing protein [Phycisphaerae bacterium]|nr:PD40 domain-containing protein [Phycisphaerae bacterium]